MHLIHVGTEKPYEIRMGKGILEDAITTILDLNAGKRIVTISDETVAGIWGEKVVDAINKASGQATRIFRFPAGEDSKNRSTVAGLQDFLAKDHFGRDTLIVALGGGVTGDIAGFVAATHLRGVPFIQIPTTVLAMVDSSVGGKVGIDTPFGKNLVGAFHQPDGVIIDTDFLSTLSQEHIVNGLFEAIKMALIRDSNITSLISNNCIKLDNQQISPDDLEEIIRISVKHKAIVVAADEKEKGERKILNFGHTIGHAVESLSKYRLLHGFAVGFGMLVEAKISEKYGLLSSSHVRDINNFVSVFLAGVDRSLFKYPICDIIRMTYGDKKTSGGKVHYVLLETPGKVYVGGGKYAHPVTDDIVDEALVEIYLNF